MGRKTQRGDGQTARKKWNACFLLLITKRKNRSNTSPSLTEAIELGEKKIGVKKKG